MERDQLEEALETLGEVLLERGQSAAVLVIGGGSLLLLGFIDRPTADVDVVGFVSPRGYSKAESLPGFLADAVADVGETLGISGRWLNTGPAGLIDFGLPQGLELRAEVRRYAALTVHLPAREDLVCFKLYAAVDQGPRSKHLSDLRSLTPSHDELLAAARWTRSHDPSQGFLDELRRTLELFGLEVDDGDV